MTAVFYVFYSQDCASRLRGRVSLAPLGRLAQSSVLLTFACCSCSQGGKYYNLSKSRSLASMRRTKLYCSSEVNTVSSSTVSAASMKENGSSGEPTAEQMLEQFRIMNASERQNMRVRSNFQVNLDRS